MNTGEFHSKIRLHPELEELEYLKPQQFASAFANVRLTFCNRKVPHSIR